MKHLLTIAMTIFCISCGSEFETEQTTANLVTEKFGYVQSTLPSNLVDFRFDATPRSICSQYTLQGPKATFNKIKKSLEQRATSDESEKAPVENCPSNGTLIPEKTTIEKLGAFRITTEYFSY